MLTKTSLNAISFIWLILGAGISLLTLHGSHDINNSSHNDKANSNKKNSDAAHIFFNYSMLKHVLPSLIVLDYLNHLLFLDKDIARIVLLKFCLRCLTSFFRIMIMVVILVFEEN